MTLKNDEKLSKLNKVESFAIIILILTIRAQLSRIALYSTRANLTITKCQIIPPKRFNPTRSSTNSCKEKLAFREIYKALETSSAQKIFQ